MTGTQHFLSLVTVPPPPLVFSEGDVGGDSRLEITRISQKSENKEELWMSLSYLCGCEEGERGALSYPPLPPTTTPPPFREGQKGLLLLVVVVGIVRTEMEETW